MRPHIVLPTEANLRFYRRLIAAAVIVAVCAFIVGLFALSFGGRGGRSPIAFLLGSVGFVGAVVAMRSTAAKLEQQIRQLASYGQRYPVRRLRTERMRRGEYTHWHVVVATWIDEQGQSREALSDPFHYDPAPLLDPLRTTVLADRFEPELCLVHAEGLPPFRRRRLSPAQAATIEAHSPTSPIQTLLAAATIVAGVLLLGALLWLVSLLV